MDGYSKFDRFVNRGFTFDRILELRPVEHRYARDVDRLTILDQRCSGATAAEQFSGGLLWGEAHMLAAMNAAATCGTIALP